MKVLQINSFCGVGSTGRIATDLYKVLEKKGHECLIAYGREAAPTGINSIRIGSDSDVNFHGIMSRMTDKQGFYSKKATKEFILNLKEYNPDIIHLHNIHGYYINIEELFHYLAEASKPVVWTLHDCWAFTGHCPHFDYIGCGRWKAGCFRCPQKREYPASFFADNSKRNYEKKKKLFTSIKNMTIVTPSEWLAGLVRQSFLRKYPVKVIRNGVNQDVFKPTESNFRESYNLQEEFIILGVASIWNKRKGLNYFIELSKRLDSKYKIIVVGVTEKQKKSLPGNILGIIKTDNTEELTKIYTAADIFVNPTLEDNFPTTNLEALACGTPVITFDTGGSPECIDNTCGLVLEKGELDALQTALQDLKSKNFLQKDCLARAKQFNMNERFEEYVLHYEQLI